MQDITSQTGLGLRETSAIEKGYEWRRFVFRLINVQVSDQAGSGTALSHHGGWRGDCHHLSSIAQQQETGIASVRRNMSCPGSSSVFGLFTLILLCQKRHNGSASFHLVMMTQILRGKPYRLDMCPLIIMKATYSQLNINSILALNVVWSSCNASSTRPLCVRIFGSELSHLPSMIARRHRSYKHLESLPKPSKPWEKI